MKNRIELDPLCLNGKISFAINNRSELIPCCMCDDPKTVRDPIFQKLLIVSNINNYDNIEDILNTKEWIDFKKNLENHIGFPACVNTCRKNKPIEHIQTTTMFNTESNKITFQDKR